MRKILLIVFLGVFCCKISAQERYTILVESPEDIDSKVTNHQYLFPEFTIGTIVFTDNSATRAPLNYDMIMDQIHFTDGSGQVKKMTNDKNEIASIQIGGREFVYSRNGFAEVLTYYNDKALLICRRIKAEHEKATGAYGMASDVSAVEQSAAMLSSVGSGGENVGLSNNSSVTFSIIQSIYLQSDKGLFSGGSEKNFVRIFGGNAKSIHDYVQNKGLNLKKPSDLIELFNFCANQL